MKRRSLAWTLLLVATLLVSGLVPAAAPAVAAPAAAAPAAAESLIRVVVAGAEEMAAVEAVGVPVYAHLIGGDGGAYLLAGAAPAQVRALRSQGLAVMVLDPDRRGATYYLAYPMPGRDGLAWSDYGRLLLDDGAQVLLRATPAEAERLAEAGAEIVRVTFDPKPLRPAAVEGAFPEVIVPDPAIQAMIDQIDQATVYSYTGDLSGEWPVTIGGVPYTIAARHTSSGTPIQMATQFAYEHLEGLGLDTDYHYWSSSGYSGRNVIGERPGQTNPEDIFILCAHIDDMPSGPLAPGADDNASGVVATLLAADILTQYQWGCTLRFALWTGEEQGLLGSHVYAQAAHNAGENIVGVLNLDMIAWDELYGPDIDLHAKSSLPQTLALAQLFADVVDAYDLDLIPEIVSNGSGASDHASFWQYGYTAILGIEDYYPNYHDFNDYYHTVNDKLQYLNMPYYVDFVKASIGTFAHMSGCLIQDGALDGHVTVVGDGAPIGDVAVTATGQGGGTFQATTGADGYYAMTLPPDLYDVTASKAGYSVHVVLGVEVQTGLTTTQDLALEPVPIIAVAPPALEATLEVGQVETQTLWITNTGAAPLDFWLHEMSRTLSLEAGPGILPRSEPVVESDVWQQIAAEGQAPVIIYLRQQADLSLAYGLADRTARGRWVYEQLRATAERSGGELRALLERGGAEPRALLTANGIAATVDAALLDQVAARPEVARVAADRVVQVVLPTPAEQGEAIEAVEWNIAQIRADDAWDTWGVTGQGVTVGNVGTGVRYTHTALVEQYRGNEGDGSFDHNYHWFDFVGGQPAPYDDNGHSTYTTGVMVGDDGAGNQIGVAPGARWIAAKAIASGGSATLSALHFAMAWMLAPTDLTGSNPDPVMRPQVGLAAWQYGVGCDPEFEPDVAAWRAADILPVFAGGGGVPACGTVRPPAALPEAVTAGATDDSDTIAPFSPRGPSPCGSVLKPELSAPGVDVRSSYNDGGYIVWSGSAASAAHLAGAAALVLSADPTLGAAGATSILTTTALCLEDLSCGGTPCPDGANNVYGWGRIDAFEAISLTLGEPEYDLPWLSEAPTSGTVAPGEGISIAVTFNAGGLDPGTYLGLLDVESNDPVRPHAGVPVTLTVVCEPTCEPVEILTVTHEITGCMVTFGASLAGTEPFSYTWDYGLGISFEATPAVGFGVSGTYPYTLTVANCASAYTDTFTGTVTVACEPACEPVEILTVTHEITGCMVMFGASLAGTEPFSYTWDYGLGASFAATPVVDFGASGTYPYTLTVVNCAGAYSDMVTGTVPVSCETPGWYVYLPLVVRPGP